jgi:hypothetical protein
MVPDTLVDVDRACPVEEDEVELGAGVDIGKCINRCSKECIVCLVTTRMQSF